MPESAYASGAQTRYGLRRRLAGQRTNASIPPPPRIARWRVLESG